MVGFENSCFLFSRVPGLHLLAQCFHSVQLVFASKTNKLIEEQRGKYIYIYIYVWEATLITPYAVS